MNSSDRRLAAAILKQKFGNSHGFQHHHLKHADEGDGEDDGEFIDTVRQQPAPVQAAPLNRAARYIPVSLPKAVVDRPSLKQRKPPPPPRAQEHKYLTENNQQQQQQQQQSNNNNHRRHPLNPVIESSETVSGASSRFVPTVGASPTRPSRHCQRRSNQAQQTAKNSDDDKKILAVVSGSQMELVDEVKRRLSLPNDTSIPDSFLVKHKDRLDEYRQEPEAPLSRIDRRQSLFEIGFGRAATYSKLHVLGAGTYSIVYKGASRLTSRLVALKEIHLERDEGVPFTAIREVSLLKQLKHCNIITLHDIIYTNKTLTLVFEYVDRDLSHYMDECDHKISPNNVKLFLFQLLRALSYCHARKILHRDIKPQNILISTDGELKLADFGLARAKSFPTKTYTDEVVTLWYRPPDVLLGNVNYGACIDMWGVGCIFFEMIAGFTLFLGTDPRKQVGCIFEILGTPDETSWPGIRADLECNEIFDIPAYEEGRGLASLAPQLDDDKDAIDLLERCLKCNPKHRIHSPEALHHKFFSSLPQEIYDLHDSVSIFSLKDIQLSPETHMHSIRQPDNNNQNNNNKTHD